MSDLAARIALGVSAETLLENAAWRSAVESLDDVITRQWRTAKSPEVAWEARLRLRALSELLGYLHAVVADGEAARGAREAGESAIDQILAGKLTSEERLAQYREQARAAWAKFDEPIQEEIRDVAAAAQEAEALAMYHNITEGTDDAGTGNDAVPE